jgi:hypothetical protein
VATVIELHTIHVLVCSYLRAQALQLSPADFLLGSLGLLLIIHIWVSWRRPANAGHKATAHAELRRLSWQSSPTYGLLPLKAIAARLGLLEAPSQKRRPPQGPSHPMLTPPEEGSQPPARKG